MSNIYKCTFVTVIKARQQIDVFFALNIYSNQAHHIN